MLTYAWKMKDDYLWLQVEGWDSGGNKTDIILIIHLVPSLSTTGSIHCLRIHHLMSQVITGNWQLAMGSLTIGRSCEALKLNISSVRLGLLLTRGEQEQS